MADEAKPQRRLAILGGIAGLAAWFAAPPKANAQIAQSGGNPLYQPNMPTSPTGLPAGSLWRNGNIVNIV